MEHCSSEIHINQGLPLISSKVVNDVVEAISKRHLIVLVGAAGCGKRSAIVQACKDAGLVYRQRLVDPSQFNADDLSTESRFLWSKLPFETFNGGLDSFKA